MTTIRLKFPAGRYHATPWGRHVNEGVSEWPPSPYRLLRALYDTWQRKCPHLPASTVQSVLESFAAEPPAFRLPPATATHTRSYLSANSRDPNDKNLVFDSFLVFERAQACFMTWPSITLTVDQQDAARTLLRNLNYLGRSESWVDADLHEGDTAGLRCELAVNAGAAGELVSVACAAPPCSYTGKKPWFDALTYSTYSLLKDRASTPPLLQSVRYLRPESAIQTDPPHRPQRKSPEVHAVMLGLDATVLPLVTTTLEVAEQIRVRLMGADKARRGADSISPLFSGKGPDGGKRLDHGHLYILPLAATDPRREGRIDRVLLANPRAAFTPEELNAIRGVRELYQSDGRPNIACVVTWQGNRDALNMRPTARTVESSTPFVPPRHWRKGRDFDYFMDQEVRRECENHGIKARVLSVSVTNDNIGIFNPIEFRRNRKGDPVRPGYHVRIEFDAEVVTPFAIGYGAHFGLGQFGIPRSI